LQVKELKKIHLSNFRKKFDDKSYQVVKDAIGKNAFLASEVNIKKIIDNITDPDVKNKFNVELLQKMFLKIKLQIKFPNAL
jgi:hypothetical protein